MQNAACLFFTMFLRMDDFTHIWIRIGVRNHLFTCVKNTLKLLKPKINFTGSCNRKIHMIEKPRKAALGMARSAGVHNLPRSGSFSLQFFAWCPGFFILY